MSTTRNDVDPIRETEDREAPSDGLTSQPGTSRRGPDRVFERYALIASLTLLILCLVWIDRRTEADSAQASPPTDRRLRSCAVKAGPSFAA